MGEEKEASGVATFINTLSQGANDLLNTGGSGVRKVENNLGNFWSQLTTPSKWGIRIAGLLGLIWVWKKWSKGWKKLLGITGLAWLYLHFKGIGAPPSSSEIPVSKGGAMFCNQLMKLY